MLKTFNHLDLVRTRLGRTTAASAIAIASFALAPSAYAANECGVPADGAVTCSPDEDEYPAGISYISATDLAIALEEGVVVDATGAANGLTVNGTGPADITVNGATDTSISGGDLAAAGVVGTVQAGNLTLDLDQVSGERGILALSTGVGAVSVTANDVTAVGDNGLGILARSAGGDVSVDVGSVTTTGVDTLGILAAGDGDVSVGFDSVDATGAGVLAIGFTDGAVAVTGGSVETSGDDTVGVAVAGNAPTVDIESITTTGENATGLSVLLDTPATLITPAVRTDSADLAVGTITTEGDDSVGVDANVEGDLLVSVEEITTTGEESHGVIATSLLGDVTVDLGTLSATGLDAGGIYALAEGDATVTFDSVTTANTGIIAEAFGDDSVVDISGGSVATTQDGAIGIDIISASTATVDVDSIATEGDNATGLSLLAGAGASTADLSVGSITTEGDNAIGVVATTTDDLDAATADDLFVTVGDVTTGGDGSTAVLATTLSGDATVTVNGDIVTTGPNSDGVVVNSASDATVNVGTGGTFDITDGDSISLTSVGTSTLNNAGTIGDNETGFAVIAAGGPVTINNSGSLTSDILLTAGDDVLNNSGTFDVGVDPDFGAGVDTFNNTNTGVILVGNGATATVSPTFTGLETLTNSGTIDLSNGRVGDTLTLPGAYVGNNGTLSLDFPTSANVSDELIVGGLATGDTTVTVAQAGNTPTFNDGTVFVRAAVGSDADAFDFANGFQDQGFVRYEVQYDDDAGTYSLTGAPSDSAFRTLNYVEGIRSLWLKSADAVSGQLRAHRDTLWSQGGTEPSGRFWMQLHGSVETREGQRNFDPIVQTARNINTGYEQDYFGGQLGLDLTGGAGERGGFAAGVTAGYINSSMNFAGSSDRLRFDVVNAGLYGSFTSGNLFINALGKYDYYWADARAGNFNYQQDLKGSAYGARVEAGMRFGSDTFFVEPAASISYVKNDFDDLTPLGTTISFDDDEGFRGRAGARIGSQFDFAGTKMAVYLGGNYVHEFEGRDSVTFTSGGETFTYTNDRLRDYGEATLGITIAQTAGISGFFEGNYIRSFDKNNGNLGIEGAGGRAGVRVKF